MTKTEAPPRPSTVYRRLMERLPIRVSDVRTKGGPIQCLRFNAAQEQLWQVIAPKLDAGEPIRIIVLKARREGVSTFTEALLTTCCLLQNYVQAMVVAHEAKATQRIWAMSQRFVTGSALARVASITGHTIKFRQSMLELATAGSPNASRSADLTCLHNSEVAFWKDASALLALRQCLPRSEDVFSIEIDESTANGLADDGELFYEEWQAAASGDNGFTPVFLPYHTFPQYTSRLHTPLDDVDAEEEMLIRDLALTWGQLRWRRRVIADECQGDVDKFNQEYPATPEMAFIMSGLPFFRPVELLWLEPHIQPGRTGRLVELHGQIVFQPEANGRLTIFQRPQAGHEYVIGADSAMGQVSTDKHLRSSSAAEVLDMETLEQVAEYDAQSAPHVFARDLNYVGRYYNQALLAPEIQASGGGGGRELLVYLRDDYNYPNMHVWRGGNDRVRQTPGVLYGFETNSRTRPRMLARIRQAVDERSSILHSRALVTQLRAFGENDSGHLEALSGKDDLLFAYGIALVSRSENWVSKKLFQNDTRKDEDIDTFLRMGGLSNWPTLLEERLERRLDRLETPTREQEFLAW